MIGALAYLNGPNRFKTITMIGPSPCYINGEDYVGGFEREDIDKAFYRPWRAITCRGPPRWRQRSWKSRDPGVSGRIGSQLLSHGPLSGEPFCESDLPVDNRADLPRVLAKTIALQCQKDVIAGLNVGEYVHKCLPNSQFVTMDATGHCPHMSAPEEVIRELKQFLP